MSKSKSLPVAAPVASPVSPVAAPVASPVVAAPVASSVAAPAAPVSRFAATFPPRFASALDVLALALGSRDSERVAEWFNTFAGMKPERREFSGMSRDARRAALDDMRAESRLYQRALGAAFALAEEHGATVSNRYAAALSKTGAATFRETRAARFSPREFAPVRL